MHKLSEENSKAINYITKLILSHSKEGKSQSSFRLIALVKKDRYQIQTSEQDCEYITSIEYVQNHFKQEGLETEVKDMFSDVKLTISW